PRSPAAANVPPNAIWEAVRMATNAKPNILVIWGDDIGITNLSCYSDGLMGYRTHNIDRVAGGGVGVPGMTTGRQAGDGPIPELLKPLGYATGQFGKNHLGDLNKYLPTVHGFDEFFGNLYHLNSDEVPEDPDYPSEQEFPEFRG